MTVRMDRGRPPSPRFPFVKIPIKCAAFVLFTCGPEEIEGTPVHWLGNAGTTAPCGRETCRWCPDLPTRYMWYAPVLEWWAPDGFKMDGQPFAKGGWRKAILRITEHMGDCLDRDLRGKVIKVWRSGQHKNSPLVWRMIEELPEHAKIDYSKHDITSTLKAVWGCYSQIVGVIREIDQEVQP
jgi:hypothetical protein